MTAAEFPVQGPAGGALPTPAHPELAPEALQAFVEADRKCGIFIFPQLRQLGASAAVEELVAAAAVLADPGSGDHPDLAEGYRELLARAQSALREARTLEVRHESDHRDRRQGEARLAASLLAAKSRLPAPRMARLQQQLAELALGEEGQDPVAFIEQAVADWERLSQVRQSREAERLADRAHLAVRPRQKATARSRKALRDQALVVQLARAFALGDAEPPTRPGSEGRDQ